MLQQMPLNGGTTVNTRTHDANKFATYSSSGPGGAGSKLTIHVSHSGNAAETKSNGSGAGGATQATGNQKLTRAVIL